MAHRMGTSIMGEANSPCKENGKVIEFDTKGQAEQYKDSLTIHSEHVFYTVEPKPNETSTH